MELATLPVLRSTLSESCSFLLFNFFFSNMTTSLDNLWSVELLIHLCTHSFIFCILLLLFDIIRICSGMCSKKLICIADILAAESLNSIRIVVSLGHQLPCCQPTDIVTFLLSWHHTHLKRVNARRKLIAILRFFYFE